MGYHLDVMKEKNWGQKMVDHLVGCSVALSAKNLAALKDLTRVELKVAKRVLRKVGPLVALLVVTKVY